MAIYRISYMDVGLAEAALKEAGIQFEELDEGNYFDECPECGEYEFWHDGHCSYCGFDK